MFFSKRLSYSLLVQSLFMPISPAGRTMTVSYSLNQLLQIDAVKKEALDNLTIVQSHRLILYFLDLAIVGELQGAILIFRF